MALTERDLLIHTIATILPSQRDIQSLNLSTACPTCDRPPGVGPCSRYEILTERSWGRNQSLTLPSPHCLRIDRGEPRYRRVDYVWPRANPRVPLQRRPIRRQKWGRAGPACDRLSHQGVRARRDFTANCGSDTCGSGCRIARCARWESPPG